MRIAGSVVLVVATCCLALLPLHPALGQNYPLKQVRIIVPWTPGGTADILARLLGQRLGESFGQMFKTQAGIQMQHIPFKGSAQAIADVIGGQIPLNFENIAVVLPHIKAGKVRALGVTSAQRSAFLPPTIAESGYPGFEAVGWFGLMAPANTPRDVLTKLNAETVRILGTPDSASRILGLGAQVRPTTMAEFDTFNREQIVKWAKVIKDSGAKAD